MAFFKSNKDRIKEENKREKDQAEKNRHSGDNLTNRMMNAAGKAAYLNNPELASSHQMMMKTLAQMLKNSGTISGYDTAVIDEQLDQIIGYYGEALEKGDLNTLERAQNAIKAGLALRKELSKTEAKDAENVVEKKENKMKDWACYVGNSRAYFINEENISEKKKLGEEKKKEYEAAKKEYMAAATERVEQELASFRPGIDTLSGDAGIAYVQKRAMLNLAQEMEATLKLLSLFRDEALTLEDKIKAFEDHMSDDVITLTEQDRESMQRMQDEIRETQQRIEDDIKFSDKMREQRNGIIDYYYNSKERGDRIAWVNREFQKLEEEMNRRANDTRAYPEPIVNEEDKRQIITN